MTAFDFAKNIIAGLDVQIQDCSDLISELETKLAQVRETQKVLENQRQGLLTLAKAGESALQQSANFLRLATSANRDDMVQAFWQGIDELRTDSKDEPLPQLPKAADSQPESTEPQPTAPPSDTTEPESTEETKVDEAEEPYIDPETVDENPILTKEQLDAISRKRGNGKALLKFLAIKHRVSHNARTTNEQLLDQLIGKVSRADVAEFKPTK